MIGFCWMLCCVSAIFTYKSSQGIIGYCDCNCIVLAIGTVSHINNSLCSCELINVHPCILFGTPIQSLWKSTISIPIRVHNASSQLHRKIYMVKCNKTKTDRKKNKRKRMNKNGHNHSKRLTQVKCAHTMLDGNEQLKRAVEMHFSHIQFGLSLVFTVSCANDNL